MPGRNDPLIIKKRLAELLADPELLPDDFKTWLVTHVRDDPQGVIPPSQISRLGTPIATGIDFQNPAISGISQSRKITWHRTSDGALLAQVNHYIDTDAVTQSMTVAVRNPEAAHTSNLFLEAVNDDNTNFAEFQLSQDDNAGSASIFVYANAISKLLLDSTGASDFLSIIKVSTVNVGTGTFTPQATTKFMWVECIGGGGGSGAAPATGVGQFSAGGGGAGSAWAGKLVTANIQGTLTVVVGAGGTAGVAGGAAATAGGDTSFKDNTGTVVCLAKGGPLGGVGALLAPPAFSAAGGAAASGAASTGDVKLWGNPGGVGFGLAAAQARAGFGGAAARGGAGAMGLGGANPGSGGGTYGGGASGGVQANASSAGQNGAAGADGIIIVYEFG